MDVEEMVFIIIKEKLMFLFILGFVDYLMFFELYMDVSFKGLGVVLY